MLGARRFILWWGMRSGKTLTALEFVRRKGYTEVLVVAPPKTLLVWEREIDEIGLKDVVAVVSAGKIVRFEKENKMRGWQCIIFDEVHGYRKYSARFRAALRLSGRGGYIVGLTGTPFDTDLSELFYTMQLFNYKRWGAIKAAFERVFCVAVNKWAVMYRQELREDTLNEFREFTDMYQSDEILRPEIVYVGYEIKQRLKRIIGALLSVERIDEINNEHIHLAKPHINNKVLQVQGGFYIMHNRSIKTLGYSDKWAVFTDLIRSLEGKKIMVFVRFIHEKRLIKALYPHAEELSMSVLEHFNRGEISLVYGHPRSVGVGIDISAADCTVFTTLSDSFIDHEQAMLRMSSYGAKEKKLVYILRPGKGKSTTQRRLGQKEAEHQKFFGGR